MKRLFQRGGLWAFVLPCCLALVLAVKAAPEVAGAQAAPTPGGAQAAPAAYQADAVATCLKQCHNTEPITFILQTPHAVKADARTPFAPHQRETCHGASPDHVDVTSNPVAVVYKGPKKSPVAERNAKCLSCHDSGLR